MKQKKSKKLNKLDKLDKLKPPNPTRAAALVLAVFFMVLTPANIPFNANAADVVYFVGTGEFNDLKTIVPSWEFNTLPSDYSCMSGTTVILSIDVRDTGSGATPKYQWYWGKDTIGNATGDTLTIKNISVLHAGDYIVEVTIGNSTVKIGCVVDVVGGGLGNTEFISSNSVKPEEPEPEGPDYNVIEITDNYGRITEEHDISGLTMEGKKLIVDINVSTDRKLNIYIRKLEELSHRYGGGSLSLRFSGPGISNKGASLDIPFEITKKISYRQSGDYRLTVSVKELSVQSMQSSLKRIYKNISSVERFYQPSFEVSKYDDRAVKAALNDNGFPLAYINLPAENSEISAIAYNSAAGRAYAVAFSSSGDNLIKIPVSANLAYGTVKINAQFHDIENHWARDEIRKSANMLLTEGKSEFAYIPEAAVTRAEFCAMLVRLIARTDIGVMEEGSENSVAYEDVQKNSWYYDYVRIANKIGLTDFAGDNYFEPNAPILREEMAYMTAKALNYMSVSTGRYGSAGKVTFADMSETDAKFSREVTTCANAGILKGINDNGELKFMPKKTHTRAEAAVVLNRIINFIR